VTENTKSKLKNVSIAVHAQELALQELSLRLTNSKHKKGALGIFLKSTFFLFLNVFNGETTQNDVCSSLLVYRVAVLLLPLPDILSVFPG
jgi:hypothetical protein